MSPSTTVWPGSYLEVDVPEHIPAEGIVAESIYAHLWPKPEIIDVVSGKIRIVNNTEEPKQLKKNEYFCQVLPTTLALDNNIAADLPKPVLGPQPTKPLPRNKRCYSDAVKVNPDQILTVASQQHFQRALQAHDSLYDPPHQWLQRQGGNI